MNLLRILIIVLLISPLEKKETAISKDWYRITLRLRQRPKDEIMGAYRQLDMDEYEECPNCFVMLAKR